VVALAERFPKRVTRVDELLDCRLVPPRELVDRPQRDRRLAGPADLRGLAERSFALLERGLGDYAPKPMLPTT
jgi:hypothetical protein